MEQVFELAEGSDVIFAERAVYLQVEHIIEIPSLLLHEVSDSGGGIVDGLLIVVVSGNDFDFVGGGQFAECCFEVGEKVVWYKREEAL